MLTSSRQARGLDPTWLLGGPDRGASDARMVVPVETGSDGKRVGINLWPVLGERLAVPP